MSQSYYVERYTQNIELVSNSVFYKSIVNNYYFQNLNMKYL